MMHSKSGELQSDQMFPMVTVPLDTLLKMTEMHTHEKLMEAGELCEFDESMGNAMFVSHQWVTSHHPDPELEQLAVLQRALKNLINGKCQVSLRPALELTFGRLKCPSAQDFKVNKLYVWYDYFCCPQGTSREATLKRQMAIDSIQIYVARCLFFVILCPFLRRANGSSLDYSTWEARGWCRLEYLARRMAREDGAIITIKTPNHPTLAGSVNGVAKAPGKGEFSVEGDKEKVGRVIFKVVWKKLHSLLNSGDLHGYRFLLNLHRVYFDGVEDLHPIQSLVPNFVTEIDPVADADGFIMARFLHDNLFKSICDRDAAGCPLYAMLF